MAQLEWEPSAAAAYGAIAQAGGRMHQRLDEALDRLEDDPQAAEVRQRMYRSADGEPLWAITVRTFDAELLLLWQEYKQRPGDVLIAYPGPNIVDDPD